MLGLGGNTLLAVDRRPEHHLFIGFLDHVEGELVGHLADLDQGVLAAHAAAAAHGVLEVDRHLDHLAAHHRNLGVDVGVGTVGDHRHLDVGLAVGMAMVPSIVIRMWVSSMNSIVPEMLPFSCWP